MSYERFYEMYPKYKRYYEKPACKELYEFMSKPENIHKMLVANDEYGKPALAGILNEVESKFHDNVLFDLRDNVLKQLVGSMVREVIMDFGYDIDRQKTISNTQYIRSATYYQKTGKVKKRLVMKVEVEDVIDD